MTSKTGSDDLLDIPPFLRRKVDEGASEPPKALLPTPPQRWRPPTKKPKPRKAGASKGPPESIRIILKDMGWPDRAIDRLTTKQADEYIVAGTLFNPAVDVNTRKETNQ